MRYEIAARSIIGGRSYQEDSWRVRDHHGIDLDTEVQRPEGAVVARAALVLVADGMGGHGGGAPASRTVADSFTASFFRISSEVPCPERLDRALAEANRALAEAKRNGSDLNERSGTTLVAGALLRNYLVFLSVGDSSIWRFRDNEVHRVNATHERAADVDVRAAELGTEEAWGYALGDESRFAITSAVMGDAVREKQIDARRIEHEDVLVFASDGIETLSLEHLRRAVPALLRRGGVGAVADGLSDLVQRTGGEHQDNTTIIVVRALSDSAGRAEEAEPETPATARTAPVAPFAPPPASPEASVPGDAAVPVGAAAAPAPAAAMPRPEAHPSAPPPAAPPAAPGERSPWLTGAVVAALAFAAALAVGWWAQPWLSGNQATPVSALEAPAPQAGPAAPGRASPPGAPGAGPASPFPSGEPPIQDTQPREKTSGQRP